MSSCLVIIYSKTRIKLTLIEVTKVENWLRCWKEKVGEKESVIDGES